MINIVVRCFCFVLMVCIIISFGFVSPLLASGSTSSIYIINADGTNEVKLVDIESSTLDDGTVIFSPAIKWFTSSGKSIGGKGITPDIIIEDSEGDPQLKSAIEYLNKVEVQ